MSAAATRISRPAARPMSASRTTCPPGTVPESIELHADPISAGVELPLAVIPEIRSSVAMYCDNVATPEKVSGSSNRLGTSRQPHPRRCRRPVGTAMPSASRGRLPWRNVTACGFAATESAPIDPTPLRIRSEELSSSAIRMTPRRSAGKLWMSASSAIRTCGQGVCYEEHRHRALTAQEAVRARATRRTPRRCSDCSTRAPTNSS